MAAVATTVDVFHAIAERRRRELMGVLARGGEQAVGTLVRALRLPQPAVSKHLAVLRRAGLVSVSKRGQHRLYQLNPAGLRPVQAWVGDFERLWAGQLDRIKQRAEGKGQGEPKPET